jgi:molybdopterin-guanine dinucleotide biosynthesis protein A
MLARLALHAPGSSIVAPRSGGGWEPLVARYDPERVLPEAWAALRARRLSLQPLLDALGAVELPLDAGERHQLHDWDTPEDVRAGGPKPR